MAVDNPPENKSVGWPSALVASSIILLIGAITITAIIKYPTTEDALKIWAALAGIVGLVTGAFVTYFFTRAATQEAQDRAKRAEKQAENAQLQAEVKRQETSITQQALTRAVGFIPPDVWEDKLKEDETIKQATALLPPFTGRP